MTSPSTSSLLVNFGQLDGAGLLPREGENSSWGPIGDPSLPSAPRAPPAPQRPCGPVAPESQSQPRRLSGRGDRRGLGAGSRAQHCHYLTQQEQCWEGVPRRDARCDRLCKLGAFFFNLVITFHFQGFIFLFYFCCCCRCYATCLHSGAHVHFILIYENWTLEEKDTER